MRRFAVIFEESAQIEAYRRVISSIAVITSWPYEVVRHLETLTPKALANFSPRLERQQQPWVQK